MRTLKTFPLPWRTILSTCEWVDEARLDRRDGGSRRRCRPHSNPGVDVGDDDVENIVFSRRGFHDRRPTLARLKTTLHCLPHPKHEFRRLIDFLGEPVPVIRSPNVDRG